jgi:hypothetical protein
MSEPTLLESRLSKVEQDNRRLKLALGALLLVLAATAVMSQRIPDVIQARDFLVIDENGTTRAQIDYDGITLWGENGTLRASMGDLGIRYYDENGTRRASMSETGIFYTDENGLPRVQISSPAITLWGENGNMVWGTICAPIC